ncbi:DUF3822 family protein [Carboxylicivirga linearis]|uniref:DUF3822 family protein n=1 Tax=Carboxylicivirga linearis TaxID=1628157 RepID=A0ABS5JUL0_9BACT|nr:DUF3822 family protein [Carboxylicivirga linearis]MBS2098586.1 DUF3822 family protein [Carboxylicivirga linearis]
MTKTYVVSSSFDESITTSYFLSIRSASDGLSFCVLDPVTNTYIAYANIPFKDSSADHIKTQELLITEKLLNLPYKKVLFMIETPNATLVPTALYDPAKKQELFNLNHSINSVDCELQEHKIKMADAWNIFAIPKFLYHLIKNQFDSVSFYQQHSPFVEGCLLSAQNKKDENSIHIDLHDHFFDIVVMESRALKLCNSFKFTTPNDFIYFVLFTFEQLKMSTENTRIHLHGVYDRQNPYYLALKNYLRQTKIVTPSYHFNFSDTLKIKDQYKQEHHNLFNLAICV